MQNRIDIKAVKLNAVGTLLNNPETGLSRNKIILVTSASLIYGTFVDQNELTVDAKSAELALHPGFPRIHTIPILINYSKRH